jgi:nicotinamidase-related amidase
MSITTVNSALLIVDVQNGFINNHTKHIPQKIEEELIHNYKHLFATRFYNTNGSQYERLIGWYKLKRNTPDFELAIKLPEHANIIDKKNKYTCVDRNLKKTIKEEGITSVHICGIDTSICVTKCATDLFESNIKPFVLVNYCASTAGQKDHDCAVNILRRLIGKEQVIIND